MFNIFKNVIETSDFDLRDILNKIEESYIKSSLSKEEQTELEEMARQHAKPENSYASLQSQIDNLAQQIKLLKETVEANAQGTSALKDAVEKLGGIVTTPTAQPEEEYPEYKQPIGSYENYKKGDKITFEGDKYECIVDECGWSPIEYPAGWKKVKESE